jgi:conjugal transfer pilus assembly protein TraW
MKFFITIFLFVTVSVFAKDLGVMGNTYPIVEEDFLNYITDKIKLMKNNGDWQKLQEKMATRVKNHADRPQSLLLPRAEKNKTWKFNPGIVLTHDLSDIEGRILARAGDEINPLDLVSLSKVLLFYDGDDLKQVAWAKEQEKYFRGKTKLILVNGSISEQNRIFAEPIYFDQAGRFITHFSIRHVPAMVKQKGKFLEISEIKI